MTLLIQEAQAKELTDASRGGFRARWSTVFSSRTAIRSAIHRAQHLNIPDGIYALAFRDPVLDQSHKGGGDLLRGVTFDEMTVGAGLGRAEVRHLPLADQARAGNDFAGGGLAEDLGKANDRHDTTLDPIAQGVSRAHGEADGHPLPGSEPRFSVEP